MTGIIARDLFLNLVLALLGLVVLMLPWLNPPTRSDSTPPPGNVFVEMRWPDGLQADVDLWVRGPGDEPVGYSRKSGYVFDLLRDDLGSTGDPTDLNFEFAFSRGTPAGEYVVNVHMYNPKSESFPIVVQVTVGLRSADGASVREIASRTIELWSDGQEETVVRFRLDGTGRLVPGSVNHVFMPLRAAAMRNEAPRWAP